MKIKTDTISNVTTYYYVNISSHWRQRIL